MRFNKGVVVAFEAVMENKPLLPFVWKLHVFSEAKGLPSFLGVKIAFYQMEIN